MGSKMNASDLSKAIRADETFEFQTANGGRFFFEIDSPYGSRLDHYATAAEMRAALPEALRIAYNAPEYLEDDLVHWTGFFNGLIESAEADRLADLPAGELAERRERVISSAGMLGTGAGSRTAHEVLVRLSADWSDPRGQFLVERKAGDEVWIEVGKPFDRV